MFGWLKAVFGAKDTESSVVMPRRILIVDDDDVDLALIRKTVETLGHEAVTAKNGKEGLDAVRAQKPDLILADCRMPEMDGITMCKALKEETATKDIPIVFLTGVETPKTVVECFDMGVENYICKPISRKVLTTQIKNIFSECLPRPGSHPA